MKPTQFKNVVQLRPAIEVFEARYLKNLASALTHYLENPHGNELVFFLGSGSEKDNKQALATWVANQRNEIFEKRLEGRSPLDYLIDKLEELTYR